MEIVRNGYTVTVSEGEVYVDNQARGRSGHMSHAMAEFAPGCFIDFNSNCSALRADGHSTYGWIEYRISRDGGATYSEAKKLPYSVKEFEDGVHTISVEKAVATDDGAIIAFCLRNDANNLLCCDNWDTPYAVISRDGGATWEEPREVSPYAGRIYAALNYKGDIYFLESCSKTFFAAGAWCGKYRLFKSTDGGESFSEVTNLPFDYFRRAYGAMIFDTEGSLHAYVYNETAERQLDHAVSRDGGETWELNPPCYMAKGIRNPQIALVNGVYVMHGRGANARDFVLYTSTDAVKWDEGAYMEKKEVSGFYSNNLLLKDGDGELLLIQNSQGYELSRVNVMHRTLRVKRG